MRNEREIKSLAEELSKLTAFIGEHGSAAQVSARDFKYACDVSDTLSWILEEIPTEIFTSAAHINLEFLKDIAAYIETTTGEQ